MPGQALSEDPPDGRRGRRIGVQAVRSPTPRGVGLVRVRPGISEPVPVRRTATQVPPCSRVCTVIAVRTRILVLVISRFDDNPSPVIVFSSCSEA